MYSNQTLTYLENRIAWANPVPPNTDIVLTNENLTSTSGRYFNSFHQLSIVENVWNSVVNMNIDNTQFNAYLSKLRKDCVHEVLYKVFDINPYANAKTNPKWISENYKTDYSDVILSKSSLFDEAIGYAMASRVMQLVISTTRSNIPERKNAEFYQIVKTELEGVVNQEGVLIANGVNGHYNASIISIINILFPLIILTPPEIAGKPSSGANGELEKKPRFKFVKIW